MHKVLLVVASLEYSGTSKQLALLAAGLPRCRFEVRVLVLGDGRPQAETLRAGGITVDLLGWKRQFDFGLLGRLRQRIVAFCPDVIHAWELPSLRILAIASAGTPCRLIASSMTDSYTWDRGLLRRADLIFASGTAEAEHYRRQRIPEGKIVEVPPGVVPTTQVGTRQQLCRTLGIEIDARLVLCAGPLVPEKGFQDAIWTSAILRYLFEDLHLIFLGAGPDRLRLEQFVQTSRAQSYVHFLGAVPDAAAVLGLGDVVWVPSRKHGGVNVALEAMAAGRPVVASRLPALTEIVTDGESGFLIRPGDKVALARRTRCLLEDRKRCQQMGEAGRQRIERDFSAAQLVSRVARLYEEVTRIGK